MTKTFRILVALALVTISFSACKTKQKVSKIPGANVEATAPATTPVATTKPQTTTTTTATGSEVTRNEKFSLADGETNIEALKYKYHVVVGSFKSQVNAKDLQSKLKKEGNSALVVINEQGMYRVLIASFNEYAQARSRISQLSERFADAWVLVQK
jgi:cell division protein FtsN